MAFQHTKKRIVREGARRQVLNRVETRDGILWEILSGGICRVKVPGYDGYVLAKYPENVESKPTWMKPGNSVKIMHTSGNRNMFEIVGHGQAVPSSGGAMFPVMQTGVDALITGVKAFPFNPPFMAVWISTGTYRLNGQLRTLDIITLENSAGLTVGCGLPLNSAGGWVAIDAAHSSQYRIDIVVIDDAGAITVVKGTNSATLPLQPATPTDKLLITSIFVTPGTTYIGHEHIGRSFAEAVPSQLLLTQPDDHLDYPVLPATESYMDLVLSVMDQYGKAVNDNWSITATLISGTGKFSGNNQGYDQAVSTLTLQTGSGNSATFRYWRQLELGVNEHTPMLDFILVQNPNMRSVTSILLFDSVGQPMP